MFALMSSYKKTGEVPPALANRPVLTPDLVFYLESFYFLSGFRGSNGFGANPLALQDIWRYAEFVGYTSAEDFLFFAEVIRACDQVVLEHSKANSENAQKNKNSSGGVKSISSAPRRPPKNRPAPRRR